MFFPFTGGSGGSNLAQNPPFSIFVGNQPQKVQSGRFGVFLLLFIFFIVFYILIVLITFT
jgi:hypothetical protein